MSITTPNFDPLKLLILLFVTTTFTTPINGLNPRKLDDTTVTGPPDSGIKCTSCSPCNNPCNQIPPPPPPPPPKKPPTQYCPPPPPSSFIYITGPPGNLYPVDPYFSGGRQNFPAGLPLLMGCGLVGLLAFW
ncbi:T-cell surface glycoprotein CD8 beta chain like [Actinidia chinensis var. chinensis]|uniref:T-cell surface glycoprotein CD8 beta chain like n=1 Tax=Actinidia chinensis var. chinensis TaxID=1590841 RepID=A0A2R6PB41_ACTCC|nr:T-cell surface glycoprotein CD8 beta chain like [Actinidia chinensis var. chinensis]